MFQKAFLLRIVIASENMIVTLFVLGFMPYQKYFSYLMATVHKSMFLELFLISSSPVHYPYTRGPVVMLFP